MFDFNSIHIEELSEESEVTYFGKDNGFMFQNESMDHRIDLTFEEGARLFLLLREIYKGENL